MKILLDQFRGWRKSEIVWLCFSISSIVSLSILWGDGALGITAAATGMAYTVLAGKGKVSCFLFGLINTPIYAYLAFSCGYYGDFSLNVYYFAMMFPGIISWLKNSSADNEEGIKRTSLPQKSRLLLLAACIAAILPLWAILHALDGSRPLCDAMTNVLSIAAMILTVKRAIEEWVLWIAVNAIEVFMWYRAWCSGSGNISILLMWMLFLVNGIYLLTLWLRIERRNLKAHAVNDAND